MPILHGRLCPGVELQFLWLTLILKPIQEFVAAEKNRMASDCGRGQYATIDQIAGKFLELGSLLQYVGCSILIGEIEPSLGGNG